MPGDGADENPPPDIAAEVEAAAEAGTGRLCLSSQGNTPYAPAGRGKMGDSGMMELAGLLSAAVTDLELDNAGLTEAGVKTLASVLDRGVCRLTKLVLRHNLCGDAGAIALAAGLKSSDSSIATLELTKNKIGVEGAAALGDALRVNTTLTDLGVAKNPLGDAGCVAIADAIGANTKSGLRRLDLSQCSFGDTGATALADALETDGGKQWGTQIRTLYLGRNAITDEGALVLADALEDSVFLKELYLGGCRIKDKGAQLLIKCLKVNASVINLNIGDNVSCAALHSYAAFSSDLQLYECSLASSVCEPQPIKEPMLRVIASALVAKNQALAKLTESLHQEKEKTTDLRAQVEQLTVALDAARASAPAEAAPAEPIGKQTDEVADTVGDTAIKPAAEQAVVTAEADSAAEPASEEADKAQADDTAQSMQPGAVPEPEREREREPEPEPEPEKAQGES